MPRHLAIGDVHGCFISLRTLWDFVQLRQDDVIIALGDYVDRGPDSKSVLNWLITKSSTCHLHCLRGNHEIMMLAARDGKREHEEWLAVGGDKTLDSYDEIDGVEPSLHFVPQCHWEFLTLDLLPYFETESHFFVHANAYPDTPLTDQPDFMLYWEKFDDPCRHESGKTMVCGHTSQKTGLPIHNANAICIDTWVHGGGWLSCLHAESGMVWQADELGRTRKFWLDDLPHQNEDYERFD